MTTYILNRHNERQKFEDHLNNLDKLMQRKGDLNEKDREYADSLISQFFETGGLSGKQWQWAATLVFRIEGVKPLYGNFKPILVAFQIAGVHLKRPKIRLLSDGGRYCELWFYPDTSTIKVFVDGWQGSGTRKFAGTIEEGLIKPYAPDRLTTDIRMAIEQLALDPVNASKAFAAKLGACIYCGQRLSDPMSKKWGYGETCAAHYGLPYGVDLNSLFARV